MELLKTERKSPAQSRSKERVAKILDAAAQVMAEKGYDGTTLREVANQAGVKQTSMYRYWPNKQAIVADLIERFIDGQDQILDQCFDLVERGNSWSDALELFIHELRKTVETDRWIAACHKALISDPLLKSKDQRVQDHFTIRFGKLMAKAGVAKLDSTGEQVGRMMAVLLDAYVLSLNRHVKPGNEVIEKEFTRTMNGYLAPFVGK